MPKSESPLCEHDRIIIDGAIEINISKVPTATNGVRLRISSEEIFSFRRSEDDLAKIVHSRRIRPFTRTPGQSFHINERITVTIVSVEGKKVRLGLDGHASATIKKSSMLLPVTEEQFDTPPLPVTDTSTVNELLAPTLTVEEAVRDVAEADSQEGDMGTEEDEQEAQPDKKKGFLGKLFGKE